MLAGLNASAQALLPARVRARALAVYQMVLCATFAGRAAGWGASRPCASGRGARRRRRAAALPHRRRRPSQGPTQPRRPLRLRTA
ncbi:MFS transporter [Actinoplanes sp. NPDC049596]|uniref:MFS transporter n=1 Tax=unclassified Actinoplanes TaxID=2626549 RepID=UPI003440FD0A